MGGGGWGLGPSAAAAVAVESGRVSSATRSTPAASRLQSSPRRGPWSSTPTPRRASHPRLEEEVAEVPTAPPPRGPPTATVAPAAAAAPSVQALPGRRHGALRPCSCRTSCSPWRRITTVHQSQHPPATAKASVRRPTAAPTLPPPPCRSTGQQRLLLFRVFRVYPNPNPNFRVPELSGSSFFKQISGSNFENPKFLKPEIPDPKFSGYPNAQAYSMMWICHLRHYLPYTFG